MNPTTVTPLLITYNEEANLRRVLDRLTWAEKVMVVDSFSTDATLDILAAYPNVEVVQRPFESFADQCNFGLSLVETEWVLSMDADYVLTGGFVDELAALDGIADGYQARFIYCVDGKGLRGSLYPPRTVLYRVSKGRYVNDGHAHKLQVDGPVAPMRAKIRHDDRKPLGTWLDAQGRYAEQESVKLAEADTLGFIDRIRTMRWLAPLLTPLYCLFWKGLIFDGPAGWHYTVQRTYAELLLTLNLCAAPDDGVRALEFLNEPSTLQRASRAA